MEISKSLQVDIRNIQNQLKAAIQNHQVMVLKQRSDPSNIQIKKEIGEVQKYIISLGESQKHVIQRLRKELEANSTNSTLAAKNVSLSLGFEVSSKPKPKLHTALINNNSSNNNNNNNNGNGYTKGKDTTSNEKGPHPIHKPKSFDSSCVQQLSRTSPVVSEDSQRLKETPCDPNMADKVNFLSAVGLVTREVLSELQNRRVERKRRSTANHTQFVYGNNWDVSKRKKNSYLVSGSTPTHHVTRSQRAVEPPASSCPAAPPPPLPCPPAPSTLVSQDGGALCIPGLPATLTIERVSSPPRACMVCHKTGALTECNSCNVSLHPLCVDDWPRCPQCGVKQESMAVLQTYIAEHKPDLAERNAERLRLQHLNTQLTTEKEAMEQRASELSLSLATQATHKKEILRMEETVRKRIQTIHDFVNLIKSPRSAMPS